MPPYASGDESVERHGVKSVQLLRNEHLRYTNFVPPSGLRLLVLPSTHASAPLTKPAKNQLLELHRYTAARAWTTVNLR